MSNKTQQTLGRLFLRGAYGLTSASLDAVITETFHKFHTY